MPAKIFFTCLFFCGFLSGCAAPMAYVKSSGRGGGYSDTKIQDGIYSIQFTGNSDSDVQRVTDLAFLRSAEVALQNGYKYFTIISEKPGDKQIVRSVPDSMPVSCVGRHCFPENYYSSWQTYTYPIPATYFMIQCHREKPEGASGLVFDAEQVRANLREQYRLAPEPAAAQAPASSS